MKVFLHYEDHENLEYHKSLKMTLPKSWKNGPVSNLLSQFVESYNTTFQESNPLIVEELHLAQRVIVNEDTKETKLEPICSDAIVLEELEDRADVYICHGPSQTKAEVQAIKNQQEQERLAKFQNTVACTHFGCQQRFPKGGPYPQCIYHELPPVFHETAKYWACCPNKKAYDWDDFQKIPGCQTGVCSEIKDDKTGTFLGGVDLRAAASESPNLKSIDDFNKAQLAGGSMAAPILERLQKNMIELGIELELFQQVVNGMKLEILKTNPDMKDADVLSLVVQEFGSKFKEMMKHIAAEQLRIKP